jgi:hypothetical protein
MDKFKVPQIMKLSKAVKLNSIKPVVEALGDVITVPVEQLTDGDFFFLLTYQRMTCMKPLSAVWSCEEVVYKEQNGDREFTPAGVKELVEIYKKKEAEGTLEEADENPDNIMLLTETCGKDNILELNMANFDTLRLPEEAPELDPLLDYPRVSTLAEYNSLINDPELSAILPAVRWIKAGATLKDKLDILQAEPSLELFEKAMEAELSIRHGVSKVVKVNCAQCRQESPVLFNISANTFFEV